MTQDHPITPSLELVEIWYAEAEGPSQDVIAEVAIQAARWGADMELEACCEWLETGPYGFSIEATAPSMTKRLRAARRPKPKNLAEEALAALEQNMVLLMPITGREKVKRFAAIRRALERLQELEGQGDD